MHISTFFHELCDQLTTTLIDYQLFVLTHKIISAQLSLPGIFLFVCL